jgi:hypothetical protein
MSVASGWLSFIKNNLSPRAEQRQKVDLCPSGVLANGLIFIYFNQRCKSERRVSSKNRVDAEIYYTHFHVLEASGCCLRFLLLPDPDSNAREPVF